MTDKIRKIRKEFTPDQRLEYAKLMVEEKYTNQQVMDLSGAGATTWVAIIPKLIPPMSTLRYYSILKLIYLRV